MMLSVFMKFTIPPPSGTMFNLIFLDEEKKKKEYKARSDK